MSDLRVELRLKNAILYNALEEQFSSLRKIMRKSGSAAGGDGFMSVAAQQIGVGYNMLISLVGLRISPMLHHGKWRPAALQIAEYLGRPVDELFPLHLYGITSPRIAFDVQSEKMLSLKEVERDLLLPSPDAVPPVAAELEKALKTLTPSEEKVLRLRFGLDDGHEHTLEDIGGGMDLSRERIRGIEAAALRKLRHPSRSGPLRECLTA